MRITTLSVILLMLISCSPSVQETDQVEQRIQRIENGLIEFSTPLIPAVFESAYKDTVETFILSDRMAHYGVPGVSIAVIDDFKIDWARAYGVLSVDNKRPVNNDTLFEAASTIKLLGSVMAMKLVEQGLLDLDTDVNRYLKSWKVPDNENTADKKVTLRLLLSHQSGLNRPDGGFGYEKGSSPTLVQVLKGEAPAANQAAMVEYIPGSQHQYSNMGYLVIQMLLQDTLGKLYPQIAQDLLFKPLRMTNSTLSFLLAEKYVKNVALPHDGEGKAHESTQHPTALAQGGLMTTSTDLAKFAIELMKAYQGKSDKIISRGTVRLMFTKILDLDANQFFGMNQGLGVFLVGEGEKVYFIYAGFNMPGSTSLVIASPTTGKGAVIMANGPGGIQLSLEIVAALIREYHWPAVQD